MTREHAGAIGHGSDHQDRRRSGHQDHRRSDHQDHRPSDSDDRADLGRDARGRQRSGARLRRDGHRSNAAPSQRRRTGDPSRVAAFETLEAVSAGAYANLEMPKVLRHHRLSGRDASFATELALGTIRMQRFYDRVIETGASRAPSDIDPTVLNILRLGVHQILSMRVATHAAVSETVALAREFAGSGASGFVNAVLRRASERDLETWQADVTRGVNDPDARRSIVTSHPVWIVSAIRSALRAHGASEGDLDGALDAFLNADNTPALVHLVARPGLSSVRELVRDGAEPSELSPVGAVLPGGDPGSIRAVRETRAAVQDVGSQLLALALASAFVPGGDDEEWLDMCAGPGGKAALLGALAHEQGAALFCNEVSEHRTELVRRTMRALIDDGAEVFIGTGDGRGLGREEPNTYDRVLLDAPCTGLGAMRRRPESRWRRSLSDVAELAALQEELLNSAIDATRPGGVIGYATCSPHPAETLNVVSGVLATRNDVEQEDAWDLFRDAGGAPIHRVGKLPSVQLWPHIHGTDAMFFALLRKK